MKNLSDIDTGAARVKTIGYSHERKALEVFFFGRHGSGLKIFIISGQHGDEKYAIRAAYHFIYVLVKKLELADTDISFAVLPCANPDGTSKRERKNAIDIDLNRDHQALKSKECRAIHRFAAEWKPDLIIDMHNYPSRRKHLLKNNLVYSHDVFVDISNNPSQGTKIIDETNGFISYVRAYLSVRGYTSERYTIINPSSGRARHSTHDVVDSRNSFYLKYNIPTVLIEGKQPRRKDGKGGKDRAYSSIYWALRGVINWAYENKNLLVTLADKDHREAKTVPVSFKYERENNGLNMEFWNTATKGLTSVTFRKYTPSLRTIKSVSLPEAYAVPRDSEDLIQVLLKHGYRYELKGKNEQASIERLFIKSVTASKRPCRCPREIDLSSVSCMGTLENYAIFPTDQQGGRALSVYLEPESKYGLHRLSDLNLPITKGSFYPVVRVKSENEDCRNYSFKILNVR